MRIACILLTCVSCASNPPLDAVRNGPAPEPIRTDDPPPDRKKLDWTPNATEILWLVFSDWMSNDPEVGEIRLGNFGFGKKITKWKPERLVIYGDDLPEGFDIHVVGVEVEVRRQWRTLRPGEMSATPLWFREHSDGSIAVGFWHDYYGNRGSSLIVHYLATKVNNRWTVSYEWAFDP